jgi:hypothetical protein
MSRIPTVPFGPVEVTRLIVGGNPFCGNSHFSRELSQEMREYFTPERVVETLRECEAAGINTFQGRGDFHRVMYWLELFRREGGRLHWIAQTASEMRDIDQNIRVCAAVGAVGIYHHGTETDRLWREGRQDVVADRLRRIRDTGARVGLGTHVPEVIEYADEHDWDVDFYMACFYNLSRVERRSALVAGSEEGLSEEPFFPEDPPRMCETIRATSRQCLAFKILGAGRVVRTTSLTRPDRPCATQDEVAAAFRFAFENIKPKDAVVVGMFPKYLDQVRLNVEHTLAAQSSSYHPDNGGR